MVDFRGLQPFELNRESDGNIGIRGIKTCPPFNLPFMIVDDLMTFPITFLTTNRVSLQSRGGFIFLNTIIGEPICVNFAVAN